MVATPRAVGRATYEEYHPFGTTSWWATNGGTEVSAKRYRYTGKERDEETGFGYHGARYYVAWLGRWERPDPLGLDGGLNRYRYASNDPTGRYDPSGTRDLDTSVDARVDSAVQEPRSPDVIVIITGWGGPSAAGQPIKQTDALGSGAVAEKLQNGFPTFNESPQFKGVILEPGLGSDSTIETAKKFIIENGSSDTKVVIQGFSKGGDAAVDLAKSLKDDGIQVDLLVTVDAALGPLSPPGPFSPVDRVIPSNVTTNVNYYQTTPSKVLSRGYPNQAADPSVTSVYNIEVPPSDFLWHESMMGLYSKELAGMMSASLKDAELPLPPDAALATQPAEDDWLIPPSGPMIFQVD